MKFNTNPVRGTVDYLPAEMEVRSYAENIILETYRQNGFLQIKTPILENLSLLTNGDSGDNQKLMFKTVKRGADLDLTKSNLTEADIVEEGLRYDLTVPLVRFFSNNREKLPFPFKAIQIDEAFRAERPQKGRVRQFTQCDIDILGDSSPFAEVELLYAGITAYQKLGFKNLTIKINDRRILNSLILGAGFETGDIVSVCISLDKFDKIGFDGVEAELKEKFDNSAGVSKLIDAIKDLKSAKSNAESFEKLAKFGIESEVLNNLMTIISNVETKVDKNFRLVYDVSIIRGQGYYTGTIYEVFDDEFNRAIGAGGRYDNMVEKFTGTKTAAVGFSIGFYSTVMLMMEKNLKSENKKIAVIYNKGEVVGDIMDAKINLISRGFEVSAFEFPKNFNNFAEKLKLNGINKIVKIADLNKIIDL